MRKILIWHGSIQLVSFRHDFHVPLPARNGDPKWSCCGPEQVQRERACTDLITQQHSCCATFEERVQGKTANKILFWRV